MSQPQYDLAVLGGGMAGYYAALEGVRKGLKVALVEPRGFLGHELTATGHHWIINGSSPHEVFEAVGSRKKVMLQSLRDAGVTMLLMSSPAGIFTQDGKACGVLLANKFGTQYLPARQIVDTTSNAVGFSQLGKAFAVQDKGPLGSYCFTVQGVRTQYEDYLPVPEAFGMTDNQIFLHPSILPNTLSIEMRFPIQGPLDAMKRGGLESRIRLKAHYVFHWLRQNMPRYGDITLSSLAEEVLLQQNVRTVQTAGMVHLPLHWNEGISTADLDACAREAARLIQPHKTGDDAPNEIAPLCLMVHGEPVPVWDEVEREGMPSGAVPLRLNISEMNLPRTKAAAVVAGSGSAGIFAMLGLLKKGIDSVLIGPSQDPGGNRTLGRVSKNYHGFIEGMAKHVNEQTAELSSKIGGSGEAGDRTARILLYHRHLQDPACTFLGGHTVCGVRLEGDKVKALFAVNADGLCMIEGDICIDATSDGDVAAFAGVPYDLGCPIDGLVMTNGQWGDSAWRMEKWTDAPYHTDYDVVRPDRYDEWLRAIAIGHGKNSDLDFASYPNIRESRRIHGEYTLTLSDILLNRPFDDVIVIACTPYDTHGVASSVLLRMGMLEFNENPILTRVPYRCFIPKGIQGLLVGGKAPSATREAASFFRMNADVENAGYALGLIAALCVQTGLDVREIPLAEVQNELLALGSLQPWAYDPPINERAALKELKEGAFSGLLHAILQPKETMMPLVWRQYQEVQDETIRENHAMALTFWGHPEGVEAVKSALAQASDIDDPSILLSDEGYGHKYIRWDGEMGKYFRINRMITLLGIAQEKSALPVILPFLEKASAGGPPVEGEDTYHKTRLDKRCVPYFDRLLSLMFAAERLADVSAVEALNSLINKPFICGYCLREGDRRESLSTSAWLELGLARALARCGGLEGVKRLELYTQDVRVVFADHARSALKDLEETVKAGKANSESRLIVD